MFYTFMTLNDGSEISHSGVLEKDGREEVKVCIRKPINGTFHSASCWLPDYKWEKIDGFSKEEIEYYREYIATIAHIIMQLAREGGFENCI